MHANSIVKFSHLIEKKSWFIVNERKYTTIHTVFSSFFVMTDSNSFSQASRGSLYTSSQTSAVSGSARADNSKIYSLKLII